MDRICEIDDIKRLIEHFKLRPTFTSLNTIYIILKGLGYKDAPKIQYKDRCPYTLDKDTVNSYCDSVEKMICEIPQVEEIRKKNIVKEVHMFPESALLPKNVYVSEKNEDEKLEDHYVDEGSVTDSSESGESAESEIEDIDDGYEIYDAYKDEDEFSD